jgi:hypothetical protein
LLLHHNYTIDAKKDHNACNMFFILSPLPSNFFHKLVKIFDTSIFNYFLQKDDCENPLILQYLYN